MSQDFTIKVINDLIRLVNSKKALGAKGLKNKKFPDMKIASLHNHLGNTKHFLDGSSYAMNASDQFLMIRGAAKELEEVKEDIYDLFHQDIINDRAYDQLSEQIHITELLLSRLADPDYL